MSASEYIFTYILSGFIGWIFEYMYNPNNNSLCRDTFNKEYLKLCLPFLHVWAFGGIFLLYLSKNFNNYNVFLMAIIAGIILTIMEGIFGMISYKKNGYQTWNYSNHFLPFWNNYCAIDITIGWIIISLIFLTFYPKIFKNISNQ